MTNKHNDRVWHKVLAKDELPEGRVTSVTCHNRTLCMTRYKGQYGALDNKCPHQGGPLGEGSIENGLLRCPWHGWDYDPISGKAPGFDDGVETFPLEERDDGIYVGFPQEQVHINTVGDLMMETMTNWGVKQVFGMVGHSNLGVADALRIQEQQGRLTYCGIRHEGAAAFACSAYGKLTGKPAACLSIAGPGATNLLTGLWDANVDRAAAPDAIIAVDVGNNTYSFGRYFECDRHSVLMSGYLGSIGFSFPAAMGAWAATQEDDPRFKGRQVISVSGDGGLGQYLAEINTAVKYGMNITHVLMNNGELGKISKEQRAGNWEVWQTSLHNPEFAAYAELCGALGIRVTQADNLDAAFEKAMSHAGPALVEVMTDAELV